LKTNLFLVFFCIHALSLSRPSSAKFPIASPQEL
jgi:hypothetical protein